MPWAGAALAVLLWGGTLVWVVAAIGIDKIFLQPPLVLAGGFAALLAPGLALICAGVMARESARSSQANAVVLASARQLLDPADMARQEASSVAEAVARETQNINRAIADTRQRLDGLKHDIETSVTAALKAAEIVRADSEVLVQKMSSERQSMTQLAESLRNQSESLAKAIPRHAQMMSEAARAAQDQVRQADATLDQRLKDLDETAGHLAERIGQLDTMGAESRKRAQNLGAALMRLDEQLVQSTRMVESASKAGELASAAAKSTAESLRDAMSDALGAAMKATETINARSAQASEDARDAMARLKEAGLQAEATTRAAALAAKAHVHETEQRVNQISELMFRASTKAATVDEGGLERLKERMEQASQLIGQMRDEPHASTVDDLVLAPEKPQPSIDDLLLEKAIPAASPPAPGHSPSVSPLFFGAERDAPAREQPKFEQPRQEAARRETPRQETRPEPPWHEQTRPEPHRAEPVRHEQPRYETPKYEPPKNEQPRQEARPQPKLDPIWSEPMPQPNRPAATAKPPAYSFETPRETPRPAPEPAAADDDELVLNHIASLRRPVGEASHDPFFGPATPRAQAHRDIFAEMDEMPGRMREEAASLMIDRLDRAGVRLGVVKASDLRRIASAAHQGERQRRRAIRDTAPGEIQRVSRLLDQDRELQTTARTFVTAEEPDALRLLSLAERAREDAAPRLSAFLLLDAALGTTL